MRRKRWRHTLAAFQNASPPHRLRDPHSKVRRPKLVECPVGSGPTVGRVRSILRQARPARPESVHIGPQAGKMGRNRVRGGGLLCGRPELHGGSGSEMSCGIGSSCSRFGAAATNLLTAQRISRDPTQLLAGDNSSPTRSQRRVKADLPKRVRNGWVDIAPKLLGIAQTSAEVAQNLAKLAPELAAFAQSGRHRRSSADIAQVKLVQNLPTSQLADLARN